MIYWKPVSITDKEWIQPLLDNHKNNSCIYCFGNIFTYGVQMKALCADVCDCFVLKIEHADNISYSFPLGEKSLEAINMLFDEIKLSKRDAVFYGLTESEADFWNENFGDNYPALPDRDSFDYVYTSYDLTELSGKKYQPKRNHISYFKKNYLWSYEKLSEDNFKECLEMNLRWINEKNENLTDLEKEYRIIQTVFENYEKLGYVGGVLRVDGEVIAYTMGEKLDKDSFCVHFEKAFSSYRGAYPMINQQFVLNELSGYKYVNREEDLGIEGLRKAKLSYHPCRFEEKFTVKIPYYAS